MVFRVTQLGLPSDMTRRWVGMLGCSRPPLTFIQTPVSPNNHTCSPSRPKEWTNTSFGSASSQRQGSFNSVPPFASNHPMRTSSPRIFFSLRREHTNFRGGVPSSSGVLSTLVEGLGVIRGWSTFIIIEGEGTSSSRRAATPASFSEVTPLRSFARGITSGRIMNCLFSRTHLVKDVPGM